MKSVKIKKSEYWQGCRKIALCFLECSLAIYLKTVTAYVPSDPTIPHLEIWIQKASGR